MFSRLLGEWNMKMSEMSNKINGFNHTIEAIRDEILYFNGTTYQKGSEDDIQIICLELIQQGNYAWLELIRIAYGIWENADGLTEEEFKDKFLIKANMMPRQFSKF